MKGSIGLPIVLKSKLDFYLKYIKLSSNPLLMRGQDLE